MTTNTSPHIPYIKECLSLAEKSPPRPTNFRVGAVLLSRKDDDPTFTDDRILSTGYTMELAGNTHAEQCCFANYAAVHKVPDDKVGEVLPVEPGRKLVMYVTMEPCGKRLSGNAPCVQRITQTREGGREGVHKVYFGVKEPGTFVGESEGCRMLTQAGIEWEHVVGIIVARTDVPRRTILILDDSSGATIEIAVLKQTSPNPGTTSQETPATGPGKPAWSSFSLTAPTATSLTQTTHVTSKDHNKIDISALQPGTLVRVKGTLSTFRSQMQLHLERFWLVRDTNAEMQFLDTRLRFLIEVLSVPWVLTDEEVETLRDDAERCDERTLEHKRRAERVARKRVEREERHARAIALQYEKEERERERELKKIREDGERVMRKFGFERSK
ncbi:hypothetical protein DTO013E5_7880 [Penicillium roqueforti]|nr:hypothetical protein LCP963914a_105 [Penicillium roqueforti]KAI2726426.1 hypothetical protein CBS147332_3313 [Penicillium roqueforti]KAI2726730.1 hypothetical protein CBS147354_3963 [Penicillium roqueforti]KAI2742043.1 hypothetical protein DTO012A1_4027 [Penicillium roqueforti]KAI2742381.1 hypothetical protein DTO013F2_8542 [Penicillium roqueforti]